MNESKCKIQVYEAHHIFMGYVTCQKRLLDVLNGSLGIDTKFLPMSQVEYSAVVTGEVVPVPSAYINKANILFVIEDEGSQAGLEVEPKPYPFIGKLPIAVRVSLPFYTLTGQMHCAKGKGVEDVLDSGLRFLPMTDVKISPGGEPPVSFVAVNKRQILSVEAVGEEQNAQRKRRKSIQGIWR